MTIQFFKKNNLLLILIGMMFFTTSLMSQPGPRGERREGPPQITSKEQIQKMVGHLAVDIEMTDQQQTSLIDLLTSHFEAVKEQREVHQQEMEGLKKDLETRAAQVLDKDQLKDFMRLMKERVPGKKPAPPQRRH